MKARGERWTLEPGTYPCTCGTRGIYIRNCRSGERLVKTHRTPDDETCPEFVRQEKVERARKLSGGLP
jgi:hypothetical protein